MSFLCRFYVILKFHNHLITSLIQQHLCHMSLVFKISANVIIFTKQETGQTLNSYYKSHIVNIIDTILS